jgi:hypothetical protein
MEKIVLRNVKDLRGVDLHAIDGDIGAVREFYLDDRDWMILYLVVENDKWLSGRRLLISPIALGDANWAENRLNVLLTREEIETSPDVDLHRPITREREVEYFGHFGWPCLWEGELRSTTEVINAHLDAIGGDVGRVSDLLVDESWTVRYLVANLQSGDEEKLWLCSPQWIGEVDWAGPIIHAALPAEKIWNAPGYDPSIPIKRDFEARLYQHYELNPYWS